MEEASSFIKKECQNYDSIEKNSLGLREIIHVIRGTKYSFILIKDDDEKTMAISIFNTFTKESKVLTIEYN